MCFNSSSKWSLLQNYIYVSLFLIASADDLSTIPFCDLLVVPDLTNFLSSCRPRRATWRAAFGPRSLGMTDMVQRYKYLPKVYVLLPKTLVDFRVDIQWKKSKLGRNSCHWLIQYTHTHKHRYTNIFFFGSTSCQSLMHYNICAMCRLILHIPEQY